MDSDLDGMHPEDVFTIDYDTQCIALVCFSYVLVSLRAMAKFMF